MRDQDRIVAQNGITLRASRSRAGDGFVVSVRMDPYRECTLHWGMSRRDDSAWEAPPASLWPPGSAAFNVTAVRTPFLHKGGSGEIDFPIPRSPQYASVRFALFYPPEQRWDNNGGRNYTLDLTGDAQEERTQTPEELINEELPEGNFFFQAAWTLDSGERLATAVNRKAGSSTVVISTDAAGPLLLHWGVGERSRDAWHTPPSSLLPPGTTGAQGSGVQTPFEERHGLRMIRLNMTDGTAPDFISFVLYQPGKNRWLKEHGKDFSLPVAHHPLQGSPAGGEPHSGIAEQIIEKEMSGNSWTLMHRYDLCYALLDRTMEDPNALALIFVWLRFSALRQLDWQRNYNTKPRELGHALDRLTRKLADAYADRPQAREMIRLIMGTLGRGTDAQRVRDEVLNIMHRHHIKEVSGRFMEEWHQKLHNNTTYDDVVICEAYLEFLRTDGNLDRFYTKLEEGGVTRQRLESFERPIRSQPDFLPHLKGALIHDFEAFAEILREVHTGTDLGTAMKTARPFLDGELKELLRRAWEQRDAGGGATRSLAATITTAREHLAPRLARKDPAGRDLLFLDLALEKFLRLAVERDLHSTVRADDRAGMIEPVLANLLLSGDDREIDMCARHWHRLGAGDRSGKEWALQAKSILDRLRRSLEAFADRMHLLLQPIAEDLGRAFRADSWAVDLFTEEVVRGRNEFALSALIGKVDPALRKIANLGDWQVISPGETSGVVHAVAGLDSIQGKTFAEPAVLITDRVSGNEELPAGTVALLTPDTTDIVSHIAIRARNARVVFATCYDAETMARLKSLNGRHVSVNTVTGGDVVVREGRSVAAKKPTASHVGHITTPQFTSYALTSDQFTPLSVGGKSNNLLACSRQLPKWINVPASVALPFMVFEKVLASRENSAVAEEYRELSRKVDTAQAEAVAPLLLGLREAVQRVILPEELKAALRATMLSGGLPAPPGWDEPWKCITRVWASKWNERAFWSRRTAGFPHEKLVMAVLIQQVVEAGYAFVLHTSNPATRKKDELFGEIVIGLGETLVGNYPGRALSFTRKKGTGSVEVGGYPSKSEALYGNGLIFRSDSNGEDLAGYAGAGLYDSIMLPPARRTILDYSNEKLLWDAGFRNDLLEHVALMGETIESIAGAPQDIEGVYAGGRYYVVQTRPQVGVAGG